MTLADLQTQFIAALQSDEAPLPDAWHGRVRDGFAVYRNAYRSRLVDSLRETYPRTVRLVGEEAFAAAAAHHLIVNPPASWTLDAAGAGFDVTVAELFPNDPDVAELAWIEWAMQQAFIARDARPIDGAAFAAAAAGFSDADWAALRLRFKPGIAVRLVNHDWLALWSLLDAKGSVENGRTHAPLTQPRGCVVWREGLRPVFAAVDMAELEALEAMIGQASYAEACDRLIETLGEAEALRMAGEMLGRWLANGWIEAVG